MSQILFQIISHRYMLNITTVDKKLLLRVKGHKTESNAFFL